MKNIKFKFFKLQQSLGVKMLLIQDTTENVGQAKPLRISGPQIHVDVSFFILFGSLYCIL